MTKGNELIVHLSKLLPKNAIIEKLKQAISDYDEAVLLGKNTSEEEDAMAAVMHMYIINTMEKTAEEIVEDINKSSHRFEFFENIKKSSN